MAFFTAGGWRHSYDALDLVADLAGYQPRAGVGEGAARAGISLTLASGSDLAEVVAFEAATFPQWVRWFSAGRKDILIARDGAGNIAGTLLLDGAVTVLAPMLGPAAGTLGCVGVAPRLHGHGIGTALVTRASQILAEAGTRACHIGWTTRETFYRRAGYQPWRRYAMFHSPCAASELATGPVTCDLAGRTDCGKLAVCVPPPALPDHDPGLRLAGATGPQPGVQERGDHGSPS